MIINHPEIEDQPALHFWGPITECATALATFFKDPTSGNSNKAQKAFALVDWVEPEIDPDSVEGKYLECIYQAGIRAGFRTYDDLSEVMQRLIMTDL